MLRILTYIIKLGGETVSSQKKLSECFKLSNPNYHIKLHHFGSIPKEQLETLKEAVKAAKNTSSVNHAHLSPTD